MKVYVRPMLPVQKQTSSVAVEIQNNEKTATKAMKIVLKDAASEIGSVECGAIPAGGTMEAIIPWTPQMNGYHALSVAAEGLALTPEHINVPVVSRRLYFPWYGGNNAATSDKLHYSNVVLAMNSERISYWKKRGAITCTWKGVPADKKTPDSYMKYLAEGLGKPGSADGIMIDEMGNYSEDLIAGSVHFKGLKDFTEAYPEYFTAVWICGSLRVNYCNITRNIYRKKGIDLLLLECYSNFLVPEFRSWSRYAYYDQRINMARQQDIMDHCLMTLGVTDNEDKFNLTNYEIEDEVRYIRRQAPEMPGIGFFHADGKKQEMVSFADDMCRKYYIDPVLQIWERDLQVSRISPEVGQPFTIFASIYNIGGMDAKNVKVRLFMDNKELAVVTLDVPALGSDGVPVPAMAQASAIAGTPGYHEVRAEVIPASGQTLLDGRVVRTIYIAGK